MTCVTLGPARATIAWRCERQQEGAIVSSRERTLVPSGDTTGDTDWSNLSAMFSDRAEPATVRLLPGAYYLSQPLPLPDQASLSCADPSWGIPIGNYGAGSLPLQGAIIQAGSEFTGHALITMGAPGTVQHGGQRIYGVTLNGTGAPSGTHGIYSVGYNAGVKMRDVVVYAMPGDGLRAEWDGASGHQPDFWQVDSCKFSGNTGYGAHVRAMSDSWFIASEATGNRGGGWWILDGADSRYIGCRGSSNPNVNGWTLTTAGGFTGLVTFLECEANFNGTGIAVTGAGSTGTYKFNGFRVNGNRTPWSYGAGSAMAIESNAAWNTSTSAPTFN